MLTLSRWLEQTGITAVTAWRFRNRGWLQTTNICGRVYLTDEAIANFERRAKAGEFAKEHKTPLKRKS